jgi:hypothetical protein
MKFDKGIAKKYRKSIEDAFDTIINKGNKFQRFMIETLVKSEMIVCVFPVSKVNASGITGITNPDKTNKRILSERLDLHEALSETFITIAEETIDTGFQRGCEGTFVHEGRHAYDFARSVASFSKADIEPVFNPTLYELEWEAHQTAGDYMLEIGKDEYIQEGLDLLILGELNGKFFVNDKGIKKRLKDSYGLSLDSNQGRRVSEMIGLKMRR